MVAAAAPAAQPVPAATTVPVAVEASSFAISTPAAPSHHGHFPWWLALIAIPFIHGGAGGQAPGYHAPLMPTPPPVVGCKP
ncbi:MAG: hypothetical protein M3Z37_10495 [Candidatus Eremiobacteraeota bacterium]|nr:hypothetical protein [Candidatus Eremiobacteraeota bacterium]